MCTKGDSASVSVGGSCRVIEVPHVEDCLQPVLNVIPLQVNCPLLLGTFSCVNYSLSWMKDDFGSMDLLYSGNLNAAIFRNF